MSGILQRLGTFFYVVDYNTSTFYRKEDVPNYTEEAVPLFICMMFLEWMVAYLSGKDAINRSDAMTSVGHGVAFETSKIITRGVELFAYNWLYEYRLFDLNWSSPWTWLVAAIGVDFGFYWFHRASHEINLGWAAHQVHHSSEYFNLSTALRKSVIQRLIAVFFYNPLALLGVPLPAVMVHIHFNYLFQDWIHTEMVKKKLGPLEWVLNTPSHHRIHHGANKWCLDKNYAGVLIIWDRMFGTFQEVKDNEEIVYGLISQPQSRNVLWLQIYYYGDVFRKSFSANSWSDSLKALFYGPGWFPGSPRLGDIESVPDVRAPRTKYDPELPLWHEIYIIVHFFTSLIVQHMLAVHYATFTWCTVLMYITYIYVSIGIIGAMYDGWWWAPLVEVVRCAVYVAYSYTMPIIGVPVFDAIFMTLYELSTLLWIWQSWSVFKDPVKINKVE